MKKRSKFEEYEREKRRLQLLNLPPVKYQNEIKKLVKRLKIWQGGSLDTLQIHRARIKAVVEVINHYL